jgi:hypothetical protein
LELGHGGRNTWLCSRRWVKLGIGGRDGDGKWQLPSTPFSAYCDPRLKCGLLRLGERILARPWGRRANLRLVPAPDIAAACPSVAGPLSETEPMGPKGTWG